MFFSTELLSRRSRSGFGLYWLAATVAHTKSSIAKLPKKEVLTANLPEACSSLAHPPEPLALRLTSGLLLGITRVYGQQWSMFHLQVQNASQAIKKVFSTNEGDLGFRGSRVGSSRGESVIETANENQRLDAITIPHQRNQEIGRLFDFDQVDPFLFDPQFYQDENEGSEFVIAPTSGAEAPGSSQENQEVQNRADRFRSKPSDISLQEGSLELENLSGDGDDPNGLQDYLRSGLGFDDFGAEDEAAQGFDLGILPELEANLVPGEEGMHPPASSSNNSVPFEKEHFRVESEVGRGHAGRQRHTSTLGFRLGSVDVDMIGADQADNIPMDLDDQFEFEPTSQFANPLFQLDDDDEVGPGNPVNEDNSQQNVKRKSDTEFLPAQRKMAKVLIDPITTLSAEDLKSMRNTYRVDRLRRISNHENRLRGQRIYARAKELVYGVPPYFQAPDLRMLWKSCVKVPEITVPPKKADASRYRSLSREARLPVGRVGSEDIGLFDPAEPFTGFELNSPGELPLDQQAPWLNFDQYPEDGERPLEAGHERIDEIHEDVVGRHRATSYESSAHGLPFNNNTMPWNRPGMMTARASEGGYGSDSGGHNYYDIGGVESSAGRSTSRITRETPMKLRGRRSSVFSSSLEPTRAPSTPQFQQSGRGGQVPVHHGNLKDSEAEGQQEIEPDTMNFLAWAQAQVNDPTDFLFSDLAPVTNTTSPIAAQAFIKVLSLASKGLIQVIEQDEPYGEIRLGALVAR